MAMHPEVKTKWLEALRSGNYEQTEGRLRDHKGHCCIGVLACVLKADFPEIIKDYSIEIDADDGGLCVQGKNVAFGQEHAWRSWAELSEDIYASIGVPYLMANMLVQMNDGYMANKTHFPGIADFIEEKL